MTKLDEKKFIAQFGEAAEKKLDLRYKKGRMGWRKKSTLELFYLLQGEVYELYLAIIRKEGIEDEAVDVSNFAMFIYDKAKNKV